MEDDESLLIQKCINGNRLAQKALYLKYVTAMYNRIVRIVAHPEDAKDITQEVFTEVFRNLSQYKSQSSLGTWIRKITINRSIDHLRKRKIEYSELKDYPDSESEEDENTIYHVNKIQCCIQSLPDGCRAVFTLYLLEGLSHKEIANYLNISESTSKSQYHRAKKMLIKEIRSHE